MPPCFDFGLPGVLGIAFGGFLIGVLLVGALWFIKIKTGKVWFFFQNKLSKIFKVSINYHTIFFFSSSSSSRESNWAGYQLCCSKSFRWECSPSLPSTCFVLTFASASFSHHFSIIFLQVAPSREPSDNPFPATPPLLRTAVPMAASEAPRARRPVAWRDWKREKKNKTKACNLRC